MAAARQVSDRVEGPLGDGLGHDRVCPSADLVAQLRQRAEAVTNQVIDRIAAQGARRELAAALARLSQDQRDVLLLVASGLGYEETALALAVLAGTVSSRLVRARRKVREALGGQDPTRLGEDAP